MKIFINPGHAPNGNPDPGAIGQNGTRECDVTLAVGNKLAAFLRAAGCEVKVLQSDDLEEVCEASNEWGADLFVSVHCNSAGSSSAAGAEIWTAPGQSQGDALASAIMAQVEKTFPDMDIRADYSDGDVDKEARFYVLLYTDAPAALIELAFISNQDEEALLQNDSFQSRYAAAIARGVTDLEQEA